MDKCAIVLLVLSLLLVSCSNKPEMAENKSDLNKPAESGLSQDSADAFVTIEPTSIHKGMSVNAITRGISGKITFQWEVNGVAVKTSNETYLDTSSLQKGDRIRVIAIAGNKRYFSKEISVINSPPVIKTAYLFPKDPKAESEFKVTVSGIDFDNDEITYRFEWYVNGQKVEESNIGSFKRIGLKRGDEVSVKIIPFDGSTEGFPVSRSVILVNSKPLINHNIEYKASNGSLVATVHASDPDGDPLSYALKESPPGMTIDNSGLIKWNVPPDFKGSARVTVSVTDGHGGEASQSFFIEIAPEKR